MESQVDQLTFDMNNQGHQEVKSFFQQCRLQQYLDVFINEGFESLQALFEVTEEDMIAMGVKRGHRRLIQRDIVTARGMAFHVSSSQDNNDSVTSSSSTTTTTATPNNPNYPYKTSIGFYQQPSEGEYHSPYYHPQLHRHSPPSSINVSTASSTILSPTSMETTLSSTDSSSPPSSSNNNNNSNNSSSSSNNSKNSRIKKKHHTLSSTNDNTNANNNSSNNTMIIQHQAKRKYRKKPKPDTNAPIKPSSAYVMFSNHMRAEMRHQSKSFTEISKIIGEQWKNLSTEKKHDYELTAMRAKDAYLIDMQQYSRTPEYKNYQEYLKTFKNKHAHHQLTLREKNRRRALKRLDSPSSDSVGDSSSNSVEQPDNASQHDTSDAMSSDPQEQVFLLKLPQQQVISTTTEQPG